MWIAFSMYSRIPVPQAEWKEENMRCCMCFFPLVGAVLGLLLFGAGLLGSVSGLGRSAVSAVLTVLPVLVTGGIHLDGYLDTADARASYGDREKKLNILKDSHVGAFAVIACAVYFILAYGSWQGILEKTAGEELTRGIGAIAVGYVISRAFSGLAVVSFPLAKNSGFVALFSGAAKKKVVRISMLMYLLPCVAVELFLCGRYGVLVLSACIASYGYYYRMAKKEFGGITGDLAGYYVCLAELTSLLAVAVGVIV